MYTMLKLLMLGAAVSTADSDSTHIAWGFNTETGIYGISDSGTDCTKALGNPDFPSLWNPSGRGYEAKWCNDAVGDISWRASTCKITPLVPGFILSGDEEGCLELGTQGSALLVRCGGDATNDPYATKMLALFGSAREQAISQDSNARSWYAIAWSLVTVALGGCAVNLGCYRDRRERCAHRCAVVLCCAEVRPAEPMSAHI